MNPGPEPQVQPHLEEQPAVKTKKKKTALAGESTHFPATESPRSDSDSDSHVERTKDKRSQRASGLLAKQPSIVREDWEGEQEEEAPPTQIHQMSELQEQYLPSPVPDKRSMNTANVSRKIEEPVVPPTTTNQPRSPEIHTAAAQDAPEESPASMNYLQVTNPQATRGTSLSPSRSTRFSDRLSSDLAAGRKHDPLPRSSSPAKPALKHHSPTPALAGMEGTHARGSSVTPSESSDMSTASVEGPPKRKKSMRVSFDAQPEIVGPPSNEHNAVGSPAKEKKGWLGLGKSKSTLNTIPSNDDMEELMKPRPQLPSFGSVRGQKSRDMNDSNTTQAPMPAPETRPAHAEAKSLSQSGTSSEASSTYSPYPTTGVSSDHGVGAIFAQEARNAAQQTDSNRANEPLPPEVRSVEGVISFSDDESDISEAEENTNGMPIEGTQKAPISPPAKLNLASSVNQQMPASVEAAKACGSCSTKSDGGTRRVNLPTHPWRREQAR